MNELNALSDAYEILAKLFSSAWAEPARVPTQVALILLHAREYVGMEIEQYLTSEPDRRFHAITCNAGIENLAA